MERERAAEHDERAREVDPDIDANPPQAESESFNGDEAARAADRPRQD